MLTLSVGHAIVNAEHLVEVNTLEVNKEEFNFSFTVCVELARKIIGVFTLAPLPYNLPAQILILIIPAVGD